MIDFGQLAMLSVFPVGCVVVVLFVAFVTRWQDRRDKQVEAAAHRPAE